MPLNWPYLKHNANSVSDRVPCLDLFLPNGAFWHIQTHDFLASMPSWHVQCAPSHLHYDNNIFKPEHYMLLGQTEAPKLRTTPRQQVLTWNFSVRTCPHPSVASSPLSLPGNSGCQYLWLDSWIQQAVSHYSVCTLHKAAILANVRQSYTNLAFSNVAAGVFPIAPKPTPTARPSAKQKQNNIK